MLLLKNPRLILTGLAVIGLIIFVYLWRGEIIEGAQNAYKAILANEVIATNEQSKRDADNVRKEEQVMDSTTLATSLCSLGIVRGNKGCNSD